ncbi:MAG TPA: acetylornithine deacetylase [Gemmatimonadales bacterium]|nr:acetylornithine deacetylase [Gemmatimonadales bacterium]
MTAPAPLADAELLARLVAFDTTSHRSNREIADFICGYLDRPGVRITRHPTADGAKLNVIIAAGPEDGDRGLVLSGHMDVVPAEPEGWSSDPFTLAARDGTYVARGAADMKGFLALAINRLAAADLPSLRHQLVLLFTHDEETGTRGARRLVDEPGVVPPLPRAVIIGEPTSLRVLRMHKGHLRLRLTFTGVAAHSGLPHLGVNAVEAAGRAIAALGELRRALEGERPPHAKHFPEVPYVTLNVARVAGGGATNVVPADCVLDLGLRLMPGMSVDEMIGRVGAAVQAAVARVPFEMAVLGETPPMIAAEDAPIYRMLTAELEQTESASAPFGTDGGWLSRLGLDCVLCGPGSIEVAHKPNESLPVAEFVRAGELLTRVVHRACMKGVA